MQNITAYLKKIEHIKKNCYMWKNKLKERRSDANSTPRGTPRLHLKETLLLFQLMIKIKQVSL